MDRFVAGVMERLPWARAVLEVLSFACPAEALQRVWDAHRGRCYDDKLTFPDCVRILRDALVLPGNRVNAQFVRMEADGVAPADSSNFYRKLSRIPPAVSAEVLRQSTGRLRTLLPGMIDPLPTSLDHLDVVALDGKTVKHVRHQLKVARLVCGKVIGAKALVAMDLRSGMALSMSPTVDGMTNELTLLDPLMSQLHADATRPLLLLCDRQFDGRDCFRSFLSRDGDHFLSRVRNGRSIKVSVIDSVKSVDPEGRPVLDERVKVDGIDAVLRRITLLREGENKDDPVTLMTDLADRDRYTADDLLALYKQRWGIEQMFQQVTDTFDLKTLIGSTPQATLMQLSFSLLIYNVTQLLRAWLADAGAVVIRTVSMFRVFAEARQDLQAWKRLCEGQWSPPAPRTAAALREALRQWLHPRWHPKRFAKATDKGPRTRPRKTIRPKAGHVSVHRLQTGNYKVKSK